MHDDQQAIRDLIQKWHLATAVGDLPAILNLMAEDVIFLQAGNAPMRGREAFAAGFEAATEHVRIESSGEIQEIQVEGDLAYAWAELTVKVVPKGDGDTKVMTGSTLSVLRKSAEGNWQMFRDANLLTPASA